MRFSEMDLRKWPHEIADNHARFFSKKMCESNWRKSSWKPEFNEKIAIRHHKMTIALAMPQRKNHGL